TELSNSALAGWEVQEKNEHQEQRIDACETPKRMQIQHQPLLLRCTGHGLSKAIPEPFQAINQLGEIWQDLIEESSSIMTPSAAQIFMNAKSMASILGSSGNLNCKAYTEYAFSKDNTTIFLRVYKKEEKRREEKRREEKRREEKRREEKRREEKRREEKRREEKRENEEEKKERKKRLEYSHKLRMSINNLNDITIMNNAIGIEKESSIANAILNPLMYIDANSCKSDISLIACQEYNPRNGREKTKVESLQIKWKDLYLKLCSRLLTETLR
ncbi:hypothetical protein EK904_000120, partial [Melospiza melodia maxima]